MRVGIIGGTFDPPHKGHLALALAALKQLQLDEVLFVPAHRNPLKRGKKQSSSEHRLQMVLLAFANRPNFAVSDIEITRGGTSYAVTTLAELQLACPADYWFLIGTDALSDIKSWKQPAKLFRHCRLGVVLRPPQNWDDVLAKLPAEASGRIDRIEMPPVHVSSTELRLRVSHGQSIGPWVEPEVLKYITEHRLYEKL